MSDETPVERRLREMEADWHQTQFPERAHACSAGAEAIELLRKWLVCDFYGRHPGEVRKRVSALLKRCTESAR